MAGFGTEAQAKRGQVWVWVFLGPGALSPRTEIHLLSRNPGMCEKRCVNESHWLIERVADFMTFPGGGGVH